MDNLLAAFWNLLKVFSTGLQNNFITTAKVPRAWKAANQFIKCFFLIIVFRKRFLLYAAKLWGPLKNFKTRSGPYSGLSLSINVKKGIRIHWAVLLTRIIWKFATIGRRGNCGGKVMRQLDNNPEKQWKVKWWCITVEIEVAGSRTVAVRQLTRGIHAAGQYSNNRLRSYVSSAESI